MALTEYAIVLGQEHGRLGLVAGHTAIFDSGGTTDPRPGDVVAVWIGAGARQALVCRVAMNPRIHRREPMRTFDLVDGGKLAVFERASVRVDRLVRLL
jgi:hypothetical protein